MTGKRSAAFCVAARSRSFRVAADEIGRRLHLAHALRARRRRGIGDVRAAVLVDPAIHLLRRRQDRELSGERRHYQADEEARAHVDHLHNAGERDQAARKERGELRITDKLLPHGLSEPQIAELSQQLKAFATDIRRVYFARKQTAYYQDHPLFIVAFERRTRFWKLESGGAAEGISQRLGSDVTYPGETIIICVDGDNKAFRKKFRAVADAELRLQG